MKRFVGLATLVLLLAGMTLGPVWAQAPAASATTTTASETLSPEELDKLVGRIALYPDELVAIVLPASTYARIQPGRHMERGQELIAVFPRGLATPKPGQFASLWMVCRTYAPSALEGHWSDNVGEQKWRKIT